MRLRRNCTGPEFPYFEPYDLRSFDLDPHGTSGLNFWIEFLMGFRVLRYSYIEIRSASFIPPSMV